MPKRTSDEVDTFVSEKLTEWGLSEFIGAFQRERIDTETFFALSKEDAQILIDVIGCRYKFFRKRAEYVSCHLVKEEKADCEELLTKSSDDVEQLNITPRIPGQCLRELLMKSVTTECLLAQKILYNWKLLSTVIVEHLIIRNPSKPKITSEEFTFWSKEIVAIFPFERLSTWFVPAKGTHKAHGRLWDKFNNVKKAIKKGQEQSTFKHLEQITEYDVHESDITFQDDILQLSNTPLDDEPTIKQIWKKTFPHRSTIADKSKYFDEFPVLKTPIGISLLLIDYALLSNGDDCMFMKTWPHLSQKILAIAKTKLANHDIIYDSKTSPETKALLILPFLLKPTFVRVHGLKRKSRAYKPSYQEQLDHFILWIKNSEEVEEKLDACHRCVNNQCEIQPIVVAIGPEPYNFEEIYILIDDVKFKFDRLTTAIDACFKIFRVLNVAYPVQSEVVWIFLQTEVYNVLQPRKEYVAVDTLLTEIAQLGALPEFDIIEIEDNKNIINFGTTEHTN